jgi:hypothetical protein
MSLRTKGRVIDLCGYQAVKTWQDRGGKWIFPKEVFFGRLITGSTDAGSPDIRGNID